jgi:competence protein ComEA
MSRFLQLLTLVLLAQFGIAATALATVNINTATKDELVALPGIGPVKAQAILDYRKQNGSFKSVDDLQQVKGIGAKRLEKLRAELTVGPASAKVAAAPEGKSEGKTDAAKPAGAKPGGEGKAGK